MKVVLRVFQDKAGKTWMEYIPDIHYVPEEDNPLGLTVQQLIKEDIKNGTNKTGYIEHFNILRNNEVITEAEYEKCRNMKKNE